LHKQNDIGKSPQTQARSRALPPSHGMASSRWRDQEAKSGTERAYSAAVVRKSKVSCRVIACWLDKGPKRREDPGSA
jgi:hypothetical protein